MGKIFYIMGMSASGKDSIFRELAADLSLGLKTVVMYTTRPMRNGEADGREYFFRDTAFLAAEETAGRVIECRTYETICGPWRYFTLDDGQIDLESSSYLMIGTLESYEKTRTYFESRGYRAMVPLYIHVEDGERLMRAVRREQLQTAPNYAEVCRRFLADGKDFRAERLEKCGICRIFENNSLETCIEEIKKEIITNLS